ncbi:GH92 family glycosyl hydrolase [Amycolatopsis sp. NPDC059657]|uniref:GH92 family glycosyl hydrolase n=1 Tax=Amycolatopsis sp. NPDC059657 TaxID=3346899 RepID=UPI00366BBB09
MTVTGFFSSFEPSDPQPLLPGIDTGPAHSPTARENAGFTGLHALRFTGGGVLFEVDVAVTEHSELSYVVFPEGDLLVTVDVEFEDGSRAGLTTDPKSLYPDQWNLVRRRLGYFAGKTVRRILLHAQSPGWLDDVRLAERPIEDKDPVDWVRTTRGTNSSSDFSRGNTFPATAVPHGFNFWTPITNSRVTDWIYEYHRHNTAENLPALEAFGLSHQPSPWMGDRHTFHVMPGIGPVESARHKRLLTFRHENETDRPHHYGVRFENGITTDIAPADHAAIFRFTFPEDRSWLLFDNVKNRGGLRLKTHKGVLTGHTWVRSRLSTGARRMFIYAEFDKPAKHGGKLRRPFWRTVTGYLEFEAREVTMRIATSLISLDQAKRNLELEIPDGTTFEEVRDNARAAWQDILGRIEIEGATEDQLTTFYSNLYRLYLYPNSGHEDTPDGVRHASPVIRRCRPSTRKQTGAQVVDGEMFVNNGFWDTYRTTWPAYALLTPSRCARMADGFLQQYREGGWVSRWSSPGYANLMTGTSSDVAFADAYLKGANGFDLRTAYEAALKNATVTPTGAGVGRKGLAESIFLGYTPASVGEGLSWALEGCINDFGIANMATALGDRDNEAYFRRRAMQYVNHFDQRVGFFQGRNRDGSWHHTPEQFDPAAWGGDYTETNAWNTAFSVPHDGHGLVALHGDLESKLDKFFATPETGRNPGAYGGIIHEMTEARDVRLGQYGHSNQPSHHIPYIYNYAGAPSKTQRIVREVLTRCYLGSEIGQGYPGDEDNGEMSAWYVFSALGFYPLAMGSPYYAVGSPLFPKVTIHLENGEDLVIRASGHQHPYVQNLHVNGTPQTMPFLAHAALASGGTIDFTLGPQPSRWGSGRPRPRMPAPLHDLTGTVHSAQGTNVEALIDDTTRTEATFRSTTATIDYTVDGPNRPVVLYTLTSGARGGDPKSWMLEGSDDGTEWTVLDERSDQTFPWRRQTRPFLLSRPATFGRYRLRVTGSSASWITLAQWELLAQ